MTDKKKLTLEYIGKTLLSIVGIVFVLYLFDRFILTTKTVTDVAGTSTPAGTSTVLRVSDKRSAIAGSGDVADNPTGRVCGEPNGYAPMPIAVVTPS